IIFLLSDELVWGLYGKRISLAGEALLTPGWFLFSLTFIRSNYKELLTRWKFVVAGLFIGAVSFLFLINSPSLIYLPDSADVYSVFPLGPVGRYFYVFLIIGILLCLVQFENTLRFSSGFKGRETKYVIIGAGAILAYHIYLSSQAILFSFLDFSYIPVTSIVVLMSCVMMMFAVVRNRVFDVNIFVSRYIIYNSLTILFVGAYLLFVGIVAQGIKMTGGTYYTFWSIIFTFTAILILGVVVLSTRIRRKLQLFINRHFYRHKYEFRDKWVETIEKISVDSNLSQLQESLIELISDTMAVKEVFLWLHDPLNREFNLVRSTISKIGHIRLKEDHPLISRIKGHSGPFIMNKDDVESSCESNVIKNVSGDIIPILIATKTVLCTPLKVGHGELIGFIMQGEDISGEPYRKDDFDLLKAIASHAANRIRNINLMQELLTSKETEAFHQVSSFFIHDLKNYVSTLSLLSNNAEEHIGNPLFQQDALKTLKVIVSKMNGMISNLTALSKGIRISPACLNLNNLVEETLSALNGNVSGKVIINPGEIPSINADGEQLQKVLLNLLLNAIEATPKDNFDKKIEVHTFMKNGDVILSVSDHGCGMTPEFIKTSLFKPFSSSKSNGLGIGLFQCKKIVEAHSGCIEVNSEVGKGSEFRVILPK
ncbi:MAG: XrtA/PEP-CTERM system histidine kinase PrsK, partial [Nitrospirota bacterium]